MKKLIIVVTGIIACVALCASVWPRNAEVEDLPAEPVKAAVIGEIDDRSEETLQILFSAGTPASKRKGVSENKPPETEVITEKEMPEPASTQELKAKEAPELSDEPHMGDVRVVNGEKQIYILGFGWIKDQGGGSQGTMVGNPGDELTGIKVGQMGDGTTVHGKGDINKQVGIMGAGDVASTTNPAPGTKEHIDGKLHVWVPGFGWIEYSGKPSVGTVAEDMYENGHKIGSMGVSESPPRETTSPQAP